MIAGLVRDSGYERIVSPGCSDRTIRRRLKSLLAAQVDRGKQGTKRPVATEGDGIPLRLAAAGANDQDSPLLEPTLAGSPDMIGPLPDQPAMHLGRGYDSTKTRDPLEILGPPASRPRACPHRSRLGSAGPWSAPTPG